MSNQSLEGKRALVTGGSEGIGLGIAEAFLEQGMRVAINGRSGDKLEAAARELKERFDTDVLTLQGDVGDPEQAQRMTAKFVDHFGGIDVLVNNAGFGYFAPLVEMEFERFRDVYQTNVFGAFLMAQEAAKHFVEQGSGELINISSTSGLKGGKGSTAYSSSKFALRGMTECWRDELRRSNVRVMLVNPSEVVTEFASKAGFGQEASAKKLRAREIADAIVGALKLDSRGFVPEFSVFATNPF